MSSAIYLLATILVICLPSSSDAHGRMLQPPSRMSGYLAGLGTPVNYNDHEMNCGGRAVQWDQNGGKCGICGEAYSGFHYYTRPNGSMVQHNIIPVSYLENQVITIKLQITVGHRGWHEFKICDVARTGGVEATQECLDSTLLADENNVTRFYYGTTDAGFYEFVLVLPAGLTCKQCVIQWKWKCGNDWGCFANGPCCTGCGDRQEEFYACSDVAINPRDARFTSPQTPASSSTQRSTTTPEITTTTSTTTRAPDTTLRTTRQPITSTLLTTLIPSTTVTTTTTTASTTTTPKTTTTSTTTTTTRTTTAAATTSTKSSKQNNNMSFLESLMKNPSLASNSSSGTRLIFNNSKLNNPNENNKAADEAALNMILGPRYTVSDRDGVPVPIVKNGSTHISNDPSNEVLEKDAKDRLCASCTYSCHFAICYTQCPNICYTY